jgi:hypothetical protein
MPTWLDAQKPGASDTVVRWIDRRATPAPSQPEARQQPPTEASGQIHIPPSPAPAPPSSPLVPAPDWFEKPVAGTTDTVERWLQEHPGQEIQLVSLPQGEDTAVSRRTPTAPISLQTGAVIQKPNPAPSQNPEQAAAFSTKQPAVPLKPGILNPEEEEDGEFVPPPEWLQKTLGTAVADVPPVPKAQPGSQQPPQSVEPPFVAPAVKPMTGAGRWEVAAPEEPPPAPKAEPGQWMPLATPASVEAKAARTPPRSAKKKARKVTEIEAEVLIREARVYMESDLNKAADVYKRVLDLPSAAETVMHDLESYLEQDPDSAALWNLLGDAYSNAGRLQDAYRAYAESLRRV